MPELRTSAWYGDELLELELPPEWDVEVVRPDTPARLGDDEIAAALEHPIGQAPLRELARGRRRCTILVDDLTRPTPVGRILPHALRQLADAGVVEEEVTLVVASGAHRPGDHASALRKLGGAGERCRVLVHDARAPTKLLGRTALGTPVRVNTVVAEADLVVGIGGVYPQHSLGFGGGAKLALGVLAERSIARLHYRHGTVGGTHDVDNDFRRDLDEVARIVGLRTTVAAHVDADRELVRVVAGDHERYFPDAVAFSRRAFAAPHPGDADVVIANAYPSDVSLTFALSKGQVPLVRAAPHASRVLVAACPEGAGLHRLFPNVAPPRLARARHAYLIARHRPGDTLAVATRVLERRRYSGTAPARRPIHLYVPSDARLPAHVTPTRDWQEVVSAIVEEQSDRERIRALVYACAPLQVVGAAQ